jgi:tRNA(Leu) C34 or U34 (ribose-2'-O)-methylase TrmL
MNAAASKPRGFAAIGLYHPKDANNVGSVLRAAACYGAGLVAVQGRRYRQASTDTTKGWRHIPFIETSDLWSAIPLGAVPIAVEFVPTAMPLPRLTHPERAFYVFGPEDGSIPADLARRCKYTVYVPTSYCMNLAAAVNVLLYDRMAKRGEWSELREAA